MENYSPFDKVDQSAIQKDNKTTEGETVNNFDQANFKALKAAALDKRHEIRKERQQLQKTKKEEMGELKSNFKA